MRFRSSIPAESGRRGASLPLTLLLAGVVVLAVSLLIPGVRYYRERAEANACSLAVTEAQHRVDLAVPLSGKTLKPSEARYAAVGGGDVTTWEQRWKSLCPAGGEVALLKDKSEGSGYRVICALHTSDYAWRTRLNAMFAEERLREALEAAPRDGEAPKTVTVTLNGKPFDIQFAEEEPAISRGTKSTPGFKGVVAFYGMKDGAYDWFCYADEEHCAFCRADWGWTYDEGVYAS